MLVGLPLALPWFFEPRSQRQNAKYSLLFCTEMRSHCQGNDPDSGALVLMVSTRASEPKCFLTCRMNFGIAIPRIKLIHLTGNNYVMALGQPNDLHRNTIPFVGKQVGDQFPLSFREQMHGGAFMGCAFGGSAGCQAHYAKDNAPPIFFPSPTVGNVIKMMDLCMIPLLIGLPTLLEVMVYSQEKLWTSLH